MAKGKEAGRIQVYVRVRPFTDKEKEKKEINAVALHHDHSLIRILDPRRETNYFFDGVFGPDASNYELYLKVGRPLVYAALNGYKGTLLTYGQTGTGKTYTLLSEDGVTANVVDHCFERIHDDKIHSYKVTCSFLQVYQEKVYDLLNPRFTVELPVREHPKKGVYVANLTQNEVKSAEDVLALLEFGKKQLVMAETKMVRHSSRSHSIMQLIIERRLKAHIAMEQASTEELGPKSPENVHDSIIAVDETINNLLKELKQDRKTHHRRERECLKELMEKELDDSHSFKGDVIVKGKINLCDLAGSERLTKTKAEGVRLTEAKYLNTSLLELGSIKGLKEVHVEDFRKFSQVNEWQYTKESCLHLCYAGNVIHALARGKKRHVPYRNSTLTRLLQDCLGDNGKTNFIVCIAPSLGEINETKCSLNFGLRAMRIINVARLNVEVDYKVLAERLAKKLEDQDRRHKLEKLEYLREIQRLNSAVTSYEESEHVVNSDTDTLVSVIQNLSKSVQREKEIKHSLQSELTCLKRKVAHSPTANAPDIEALFLAELMSMQLLTHVHQSEAVYESIRQSDLPSKVKEYMTSDWTQQTMALNIGHMLNLLDKALGFSEDLESGNQETDTTDTGPKMDPSSQTEKDQGVNNKKQTSYVQNMTGGLRKMFGLFVGNKDSPKIDEEQSVAKATSNGEPTQPKEERATGDRSKGHALQMVQTKDMMSKLANTKEKVEKHVSNLLLSAFGEQLIFSQGNAPQWGVLGRKLSELIIFKRNNIIGLKDTEMWSNYENVVGILESCFKYVLIDKALLASMIVIEHMNTSDSHFPRLPSPGRPLKFKAIQENINAIQLDIEETSKKVLNESHDASQGKELEENSLVSPIKQIANTEPKVNLEQEINEVFDDTSRLETELFATMEEKTRLEDELIAMKDYVVRLKSDMFHLKIERANLEKEVKKTAKNIFSLSDGSSQQDEQVISPHNIMEGYRGLRLGELSDVTEASHESISGESENGSLVSEGNEQGSHILKNCLASMAQMYTLTPTPDDDTLTEGGESDDKDASLSEDDIGDSDEDDIIITKIARGIQDYHSPLSSPTKSKKSEALSESRGKQAEHSSKDVASDARGKLGNSLKDTVHVQRGHKTYKDLQIAYEDLEDELYHLRGQLSKAQQIILSLESKLKEEKENWEQIRKLYLEYKDKNDVLEGKVAILREELEKSLRENTFLKDYHQVDVVEDTQHKSYGHHSSRSPTRSPSKRKVFDLRNIPSIQNSNREMQIIKLLEENTELKTCNEKLTQEKMLAENHSKEKDSKFKGMEVTLRFLEEEKQTLKEEIETIHRRKFKLGNESSEKRGNESSENREDSVITSAEIELFTKETAKLQKELATERNLAAKLKSDNEKLTTDLERMEAELSKFKSGLKSNGQDEDLTPTNERIESTTDKWTRNQSTNLQMVFIDDDFGSEDEEKIKDTDNSNEDLKDLTLKLQREMLSMAEYQEALEKEYGEVKEESEKFKKDLQAKEETIKSLENEIINLRKQTNTKQANEHQGTFFSRLNMRSSPSKPKTTREEFEFQESKKEDVGHQGYIKLEEEMNAIKRENSELRQQITKSEQKIAIYEADLEKAMLKIKQLQEDRLNRGIQEDLLSDNQLAATKVVDTTNNAIKAADAEHYLAGSDVKLSKTTKEIERLKEELLDKEAEKGLLYDELHMIRRRKDELDKALEEAREARAELQEKMDQMAKCTHFEDTVKELTEKNQELVTKLQQSEETDKTLTKKFEKQNEKLKMIEDDLITASGEKLKGDFELRNVLLELEKAKNELQQSELDRKLLSTELNEKIEWSTNLEIQLMELKCSNECMKKELEQMKEKKRMEIHQNQEMNICRETMEKRLNEAFTTNNQLQSEIQSAKDENNELNEKLSNAAKGRSLMEEDMEKLQQQQTQLRTDLDNSVAEKKQFETKTKKLEDTKRRMDEDLKRLKDNITSLQGDLQRVERKQEDSAKKCANLEKELKRKNKELDNKQRDNRRLKKEINMKKEDRNTENTEEVGGNISEVKLLRERIDLLEKDNEDLVSRLENQECLNSNKEQEKNKPKHVSIAPSTTNEVLCNEIGWDFDKDSISEEKENSQDANPTNTTEESTNKHVEHDLSEEVGWDLSDILATKDEMETIPEEKSTEETESAKPNSVDNPAIPATDPDVESSQEHRSEAEQTELQNSQQALMAQICKEKLILESNTARLLEQQTTHLTKTQMTLEHSLCKALTENKQLINKLNDSQLILQRIKSRVQKLEEQTNMNVVHEDVETQTAGTLQSVSIATQIGEARLSDSDTSPVHEEKMNELGGKVVSSSKMDVSASSSKAIIYLTREKKQVVKELEALKQKHGDMNKKFIEKEDTRMKLEQELKLITTAYEQEKESLLHDLEALKTDNNDIKEKLKSQEEFLMSCEDIKQKHMEAERLVTALEKDLIRQTDEKNALKTELINNHNKLKEQKAMEQELYQLRNENRQVQESMGKQLEQYKRENEELLEKLEKRKKTPGSPKKVVHGRKRDNPGILEKKLLVRQRDEEYKDTDSIENTSTREQEDIQKEDTESLSQSPQVTDNSQDISQYENLSTKTPEKTGEMEEDNREFVLEQNGYDKQGPSDDTESGASTSEKLENERTPGDFTSGAPTDDLNNEDGDVKGVKENELTGVENENLTSINEIEVTPTNEVNLDTRDGVANADDEDMTKEGLQDEATHGDKSENCDIDHGMSSVETETVITDDSIVLSKTILDNDAQEASKQNDGNDKHTDETNDPDNTLSKEKEDVEHASQNLKDVSRLQEEISSDKGDETDEEADVEEKLVKILEERQIMEQEVEAMVLEMTTLKTKLTKMQNACNADKENIELRKHLEDLVNEKKSMDTQVGEIRTKNAQLEIELSDAADMKHAMEAELVNIKETYHKIEQSSKDKVADVTAKFKKLQDVLTVLAEENSNLFKEVSGLRDENRMLKNYNILEIADGSTQVSPTAIDEERQQETASFLNTKKRTNKTNDETPIINSSSPGFYETPKSPTIRHTMEHSFSTKEHMVETPFSSKDQLQSNTYMKRYPPQTSPDKESKPLSASSPDVSSKVDDRLPTYHSTEYLGLQSQRYGHVSSPRMVTAATPESESGYGGSKGGNTICSSCRKSACECDSPVRIGFATRDEIKEVSMTNVTSDLVGTESVYDGQICTDSSFASVTDFEDISFSSDWVSAEDLRAGRVTARGHRGMNKMHREMAEMKCTNTILENELTILKHRNSDFQSQLQKLAGKNNSLKQKLCERTMVAKQAEREMSSISEDKMRLEVQVKAAKEELNRFERERTKLERSLSNSKSENKRLKNDLATVKAENYKNMKQLVKLEAENKKMQSELEESREELKSTREFLLNVDNGSLTSLDERQLCASPESHEGVPLGMAEGTSYNDKEVTNEGSSRDRSRLSLELRGFKSNYVRRVSSEQSFPRYHNIAKELITTSESDNLSSPEDYHGRQHKVYTQHLSQSQSLATAKVEGPTDTLSKTQTNEHETSKPSAASSETSLKHPSNKPSKAPTERTPSQMSYDSDMSFPEERDAESGQSEETEESVEQEEKGKSQQKSIKKIFKRFSKSKKISKSASS